MKKTKAEKPSQVGNGPFCVACEFIVNFIDSELKNNQTDQEIIKNLEKVCGLTPPSLKRECVSIVDTYGVYLIQLFVQFADPTKVCKAVGLC